MENRTPSVDEFDWLTLDEDEQILWSGQPHFYSIVPGLVVGLVFAVVLIGLPIIAQSYLYRETTEYVLTSKALYRKRGILSRDVQKIEFEKIQNTSYSQGALGRYVGYGDVEISTAGGSGVEMKFGSVPEPDAVQDRINTRIRQARETDETEQQGEKSAVLEEILEELQHIRQSLEADTSRAEHTESNTHSRDQ
jgi:uncharacterized membrane protein YdbT with pleckstrin-like domain